MSDWDQFSSAAPAPASAPSAWDQFSSPVQAPAAVPQDAAYLRSHPGMDPLAVSQAFQQLNGQAAIPQATSAQQFAQATAGNEGFLTNAGKAMGQTIASPIQGTVGLVDPSAGAQLRENNALTYANQGAGGFAGRQAGNLVNAPLVMTPLGRMLSMAGAAGNKRTDIQQERAAGQNVGGDEELMRTAGAGALDLGMNLIGNKIAGKAFGAVKGPAEAGVKGLIAGMGKRLAADAAVNEGLTHASMAAQNLLDKKPITEGMGKESLVAPLIQTGAFAAAHGGTNFVRAMRERASAPAPQNPAEQVPQERAVGVGQTPGPLGSVHAQGGVPEGHPQGEGQTRSETFPNSHTVENRPESATTEAAPKNIPPAAPPATIPAPEGSKVDAAAPMPEKGQPQPQGASPHPDRFDDVQKLTDWYKQHNPSDTTGDVIKAMTPDMPHVKARVPVDFIHDVGQDVDRAKVDAIKGLTQEQRDQHAPAIIGPEGNLIDGMHRVTAAKEAGASHVQAYVPESLIGQHGITAHEAAGEAKPAGGTTTSAFMRGKPEPLPQGPQGRNKVVLGEPTVTHFGNAKVIAYETAVNGKKVEVSFVQRPDGTAVPDVWGEGAHSLGVSGAMALKRAILEAHPDIKKVEFTRVGSTGGTKQREKTFTRLYGGRKAGAVALPSREDVTGPGSIYHEEVKPQLDKLNKASKEAFGGLRQLFPVETGAGDEHAQQAFREQFNRNANAHYAAEDAFESARKGFDSMHPEDRLAFQRAMYNKENQPTPELQKTADAMYADTNEGRLALELLGHQAAADWDQQKWNMLWKKDPKAAAEMLGNSGNPNRPGRIEGKGSFLKKQKLGEFDEGLERGLVPKFDNPVDMFLATKAERGKYIAGVKGMEQLVRNEQIVRAKTDEDGKTIIPEGWSEVPGSAKGPLKNVLAEKYPDQLKGETPLIAPDGVNRILKNITTPSAIGNKAGFRLLMDANNTMTQSLLGLSGFHVKKVSQELINLSAARALDMGISGDKNAGRTVARSIISPVEAVRSGASVQKMMLGQMEPQTGQQARVIDAMKAQFKARPDKEYETQWGRKFQKAVSDGGLQGLLRAGMHALPAANEHLMQKGVFGFVQHAKLHMGSEMITDYLNKNPDATHDQLIKEAGKVSDHLDNVLGLMNRDNLFWNRTARDLATLGTLSVGWNYGSARALGGGLVDMGKGIGTLAKGGKLSDIDTRRISYLATTAALTGLTGAVTTYLATGKAPQKLRDYVFPPSGGKDREGHDIRLNTGFYTSDYFNFLHDPIGTLKAKGSPLLHAASDLLSNRDFKGDKITDWDDEKWYQNAADIAKYLGKSATPLSVQQLIDVIQGGGAGKSLGMKLAGFAGIKTAPRALSMSNAENEAHTILQGKESVAGRSVREAELSGVKGKLADEVRDKNPAAQKNIAAAIAAGKITSKDASGVFKRANEPTGLPGLLKSSELDARDIMDKVWPKMSAQERNDNQWLVRGKIGRANVSPADKQAYWNQIKKDVQGVK